MSRRSPLGILWVKIRPKLVARDLPIGRALDGETPFGGDLGSVPHLVTDSLGGDAEDARSSTLAADMISRPLEGLNASVHDCRDTKALADCQQRLLQGGGTKVFVESRLMRGIGERVKFRRKQLGLSTPQLAKKIEGVRITYQAIQALEAGGGTKHLVPIARALGVTPEWLQDGSGPSPKSPHFINDQLMQAPSASNNNLSTNQHRAKDGSPEGPLEVLGMAECGPDGWAPFNGQVVERIDRPQNLKGVPGAYGVYIQGESMSPRYDPGEIAHIHPGRPTPAGSYVLVQRHNPKDETQPLAVIKRLVRRSGSKVILAQLNPKKEIEVPTGDIVSIHRVVGSSEP